jgi:hypothetical protein
MTHEGAVKGQSWARLGRVCRDYVAFEFLQMSRKFTRHVVAAATIANGKLILFTTGASEKRWDKMRDKLATSANSFKAFTVY